MAHPLATNPRYLELPPLEPPLPRAWTAPAVLLFPCSFVGYYLVHGAYLLAGGLLLFQLARRIFAGSTVLAFLASVIAVAWAPLDMFRLDVVQASIYSAVQVGALRALLLFVTSVERENAWLLVVAGALAFFTARSYEGTLGLLFGAPLLLPFASGSRRWRWWATLSFEAVVGLGLGLAARPLLAKSAETVYQSSVLGADLHLGASGAHLHRPPRRRPGARPPPVEFVYRPPGLPAGLGISVASALAILLLVRQAVQGGDARGGHRRIGNLAHELHLPTRGVPDLWRRSGRPRAGRRPDLLRARRAAKEGLESIPWPVLRGPWRTEPTRHAYRETIAFRLTPSGDLVRLDTWDHPRLPRCRRGPTTSPRHASPPDRLANVPVDC